GSRSADLRGGCESGQTQRGDQNGDSHRGPPTVIGPGVIAIGTATVPDPEESPPPRVAATMPPTRAAAPTTATTVHNFFRLDLSCVPPAAMLLCAISALVVLVPEVAVTRIL